MSTQAVSPTEQKSELKESHGEKVEDGSYVLEEVTLEEEEEDDMKYDEVPVLSDSDSDSEEHDDFEQVLKDLKQEQVSEPSTSREGQNVSGSKKAGGSGVSSKTQQKPAVVDDFIRNFLMRNGMSQTLEAFESEWYDLQSQGKSFTQQQEVPDVYTENEILQERIVELEGSLEKTGAAKNKAQSTWDKFRKERDMHKMHHRRLVQEKEKLLKDLKRIQKQIATYEPTIRQLKQKYNKIHSEKSLIQIEKDKLEAKVEALEGQIASIGSNSAGPHRKYLSPRSPGSGKKFSSSGGSSGSASSSKSRLSPLAAKKKKRDSPASKKKPDSVLPATDLENALIYERYEPTQLENFSLSKTFKGHTLPVSCVAIHPLKSIVATGADDKSFKLWSIPTGDLILSGEGHTDWISACEFRPDGSMLGTTSGDGTLKIWDLRNARCAMTFSDHTQAVWDLAFHQQGDFVVSASLDHTAKLWDLSSERCRQTFRSHVDSVNSVCFQPFSNTICTGSGDKTVSLFDVRSGLCVQTFYGHNNSVNHVNFNRTGELVVSSDANGVVKVWDTRMVGQKTNIICEARLGVNSACFDRSGERIITASDSGAIKVFNLRGKILGELDGHEDAVQGLALDSQGKYMVSASSDCTFRLWSA